MRIGRPNTPRPKSPRVTQPSGAPEYVFVASVGLLILVALLDRNTNPVGVLMFFVFSFVFLQLVLAFVSRPWRRLKLAAGAVAGFVAVTWSLYSVFPAIADQHGPASTLSYLPMLGLVVAGVMAGVRDRTSPYGLSVGVVVAVSGVVGLMFVPLFGADPSVPASRATFRAADVLVECQQAIRGRHVSPRSVRMDLVFGSEPIFHEDSRTWTWYTSAEAQNAFGVWLRNEWTCRFDDVAGRVVSVVPR